MVFGVGSYGWLMTKPKIPRLPMRPVRNNRTFSRDWIARKAMIMTWASCIRCHWSPRTNSPAMLRHARVRYAPPIRWPDATTPTDGLSSPGMTGVTGRIIIDCMENLGLLFWASEKSGETHYQEIALAHAHTTADHIVRADGSSYHSFHFDPTTGDPLRGETVQGYADESCWSRGQSWGIHGFAMMCGYTGETRFRDTAVQLTDYALAHLPADNVPLWDYRLPDGETPYRDTSAGAIMAAGLFLLADLLDDETKATHYRASAHAILDGLIAGYTTFHHSHAEGLLTQGASHVAKGYANTMLPYGDYFFIEALLRAQGRTAFFW
jgi:unsaturated chondroitin disaccharide hydrolase